MLPLSTSCLGVRYFGLNRYRLPTQQLLARSQEWVPFFPQPLPAAMPSNATIMKRAAAKAEKEAQLAKLRAQLAAAVDSAVLPEQQSLASSTSQEQGRIDGQVHLEEEQPLLAPPPPTAPKPPRQKGDPLPPPDRCELTTGKQHVRHTMNVETPGGQHHGDATYKVVANAPEGETREERAARLGDENKKKQRAFVMAKAFAEEQRDDPEEELEREIVTNMASIRPATDSQIEEEAKRLKEDSGEPLEVLRDEAQMCDEFHRRMSAKAAPVERRLYRSTSNGGRLSSHGRLQTRILATCVCVLMSQSSGRAIGKITAHALSSLQSLRFVWMACFTFGSMMVLACAIRIMPSECMPMCITGTDAIDIGERSLILNSRTTCAGIRSRAPPIERSTNGSTRMVH